MEVAIFLVNFSLVSAILALPPRQNFTAHQIRFSKYCHMYSCAHNWTLHTSTASFTELDSSCSIEKSYSWTVRYANISLHDFSNNKVSLNYLRTTLNYLQTLFCDLDCGALGYAKLTTAYMKQRFALGLARLNGSLCYVGWDETAKYCWWNGFVITFLFIFGCLGLPVLLILLIVNVSTLVTMLSDQNSGACLYMHLAETFTDFFTNVVMLCLDCFLMGQAMYRWQIACQNQRFVKFYAFGYGFKRLLVFMNQCFLTSLLVDRYYALAKPFLYINMNQKRRAKSWIAKISGFTLLLYTPFLIMLALDPIFSYWKVTDSNWAVVWPWLIKIAEYFYTAAPAFVFLAQIVLGALVERKFTGYMRQSANLLTDETEQKRKNEKEKRLLLVGTVGLNLCMSTVSMLTHFVNRFAWLGGGELGIRWYVNLLWLFDPLLSFVNGSGGLVFHVVLCKSYRIAFFTVMKWIRCNAV